MAKINTYPNVTPDQADRIVGTDVSDTGNDANGETVNFLLSAVLTDFVANLPADTIDAITEISASLKSGSDGTLITGTAGTTDQIGVFDANGDLIGSTGTEIVSTGTATPVGATTPAFAGQNDVDETNDIARIATGTTNADWSVGLAETAVYIPEAAAALGDFAGSGQHWVKNDAPNRPWFTDDAGNDYPVLLGGKQSMWIPASAMTPATTSGAATGQIETTTNKVNLEVLDFDTTADEYACFNIAFPKEWDLSTVTFQLFWTAATGGTTGVAFGLQGLAVGDNESIDQAYGTAVVVTDDAQTGANEVYASAESTAITIAGTPAADNVCYFRLYRDVSDANDDLAEDARLIGIKLFYTTNANHSV